MVSVLCYPKCSTCQKALKWLDEKGVQYIVRNIKEENPTVDEIKKWHVQSGYDIKRFFNTSGLLYKSMQLKDKLPKMTDDEKYELLATDGMLVKRPIIVDDNIVLTGFKEAEWKVLLEEDN